MYQPRYFGIDFIYYIEVILNKSPDITTSTISLFSYLLYAECLISRLKSNEYIS